uniref:Uncharacterized protein n=1 Tax=Quercus lobata TaxID=97700 RepID=A0A7N2L5P5_QUELO
MADRTDSDSRLHNHHHLSVTPPPQQISKEPFLVNKFVPMPNSGPKKTVSCSIADLESEPGLFIYQTKRKIHSFRRKVFVEADAMARKYREKLPSGLPLINQNSLQPMLYPLRMR